MTLTRRARLAAAIAVTLVTAACGSDTPVAPVVPNQIIGASVTSKNSSSAVLTFTSVAGDASYDIERAEGATGTFAAVTNIPAPTTAALQTYTDNGLKANTLYRYHIEDPIFFEKSIRVTIEHGHANKLTNDYSSTAYWYQTEPHKPFPALLPVAERLPRL